MCRRSGPVFKRSGSSKPGETPAPPNNLLFIIVLGDLCDLCGSFILLYSHILIQYRSLGVFGAFVVKIPGVVALLFPPLPPVNPSPRRRGKRRWQLLVARWSLKSLRAVVSSW